jgi:hypothetical protein
MPKSVVCSPLIFEWKMAISVFFGNLDLPALLQAIGQSIHPLLPEIYTPSAAPGFWKN